MRGSAGAGVVEELPAANRGETLRFRGTIAPAVSHKSAEFRKESVRVASRDSIEGRLINAVGAPQGTAPPCMRATRRTREETKVIRLTKQNGPDSITQPKGLSFWCTAIAALTLLSLSIYQSADPFRVQLTVALIGLALAAGIAAMLLRRLPGAEFTKALMLAMTALSITAFPWRSQTVTRLLGGNPTDWLVWALAALVMAAITAALWRGSARVQTAALLVLTAVFLYRSHYGIRHLNEKKFDVILFHHVAYQKLLAGGNPYAAPTPVYYNDEIARRIYPVNRLSEGGVRCGYVYPPLALMLRSPAYVLAHEVRYATVIELLLFGWLLLLVAPGQTGRLSAAAFLSNPFTVEVASVAWIESLVLLLFVLFLLCWRRWPRQAGWVFGLLISSKQTMVLFVPLAALLLFRRFTGWPDRLRWAARALTSAAIPVAAAISLWGLDPLVDSTIRMISELPARTDTIIITRFAIGLTPEMLNLVAMLGVGLFLGLAAIGGKFGWARSLPHWVALCGLCWTTFYYFNRQAFQNYYFFTAGLWLIAACLLESSSEAGVET